MTCHPPSVTDIPGRGQKKTGNVLLGRWREMFPFIPFIPGLLFIIVYCLLIIGGESGNS